MKQLKINLDELAFVLHRGKTLEMFCFLSTTSGKILSIPSDREILKAMVKLPEDHERYNTKDLVASLVPAGENFITIPDLFSAHVFDLMNEFISTIETENPGLAEHLTLAVHDDGGFERFLRIVREERRVYNEYLKYRDQFFERSAREWLEQNGIELQ